MANCPAPFSDIGKKARDLLTKDYNYDHKFTLSMLSANGLGLTATGLKRDQIFVGDINTLYKSGNTIVDVKVDTCSNVSTKITVSNILPNIKTACSFKIPDHRSGKLDVQYFHPHATIDSSIGLTPNPILDLSATIGSKDISLGGELAFDTATASFTKYNAGITLNKPDFSTALILADRGQTLKASYIHSLHPVSGTTVAAEMTHRLSTNENSFTIGSAHVVDPFTLVKSRFSDNGKVAILCQREWRPKSHITFSAEYDSKAINSSPNFKQFDVLDQRLVFQYLLPPSGESVNQKPSPVIPVSRSPQSIYGSEKSGISTSGFGSVPNTLSERVLDTLKSNPYLIVSNLKLVVFPNPYREDPGKALGS